MKSFLFVLIFASFSFGFGYEKDWYCGTMINGESREFYGAPDMHTEFFESDTRGADYWQNKLLKINETLESVEEKLKSENDEIAKNLLIEQKNKLISDKARSYIYLKRIDEALEILLNLEKTSEGESIVAENIAVCYDLKKDYEKALKWLKISFNRDQMAIYSNLWVYEKILLAKFALQKDKNFFLNNSILGLPISKNDDLTAVSLQKMENFQLRWIMGSQAKQIKEQLKVQFELNSGEKELVLIHLVEELATIYALGEVCEVALPLYELAMKMGHPDVKLLQQRMAQMKKLIEANPKSMKKSRSIFSDTEGISWLYLICGFILFILLCAIWAKSRYFNK